MTIQPISAARALPSQAAAVSPADTPYQSLGALPDRFEPSAALQGPGHQAQPTGLFGWIGDLFDGLFGSGFEHDYRYDDPWNRSDPYRRYPVDNGGYIQPEPAYGPQMMRILSDYDRRMAELSYQRYQMPNQVWARYEQNLWHQTCEQIVRSWASREEKLGALGHVLNSSSMYYGAYEEYARRVGGWPRY